MAGLQQKMLCKTLWDLSTNKCGTEYEIHDQSAKGDEVTQKRFHIFVFFVGELILTQVEIKERTGQVTTADTLQVGLRESFFSYPMDNLICAVKLLKLTVWDSFGRCLERKIKN